MPLSFEDLTAVQELIASYAEYIDEGNLDGYVNNFAPDGVFESRAGRVEGRDAIRAFVQSIFTANRAGPTSLLRHVMGFPVIRGGGDRCTARTYVIIPRRDEDGEIRIPMVGTYRDDIVKIGGRWYFEKRSILMDLMSGA
jgi:ketosteroid isomerase-like protein